MRKWPLRMFGVLMLGVFLFSGYKILSQLREYRKIEKSYDHIAQLVVQTVAPQPAKDGEETEPAPTVTRGEGEEVLQETEVQKESSSNAYTTVPAPITVDFQALREINPDIVGWIYCEGTSINYPVLKGESNDTYLYHRYDGVYSSGGSIFMDYRCEGDLSQEYTVIYGHNMLADSMFNALDYFRDQEYLQEHPRFFYLTPTGKNYCLEVICANLTAYKDDLRLFELRDEERNLELIRAKAEADTGIEASNDDRLVLLATCTYDFKNAKCTLLCKALEIQS